MVPPYAFRGVAGTVIRIKTEANRSESSHPGRLRLDRLSRRAQRRISLEAAFWSAAAPLRVPKILTTSFPEILGTCR
jgi:hypothetical protein